MLADDHGQPRLIELSGGGGQQGVVIDVFFLRVSNTSDTLTAGTAQLIAELHRFWADPHNALASLAGTETWSRSLRYLAPSVAAPAKACATAR